jgi:hypothetical protein
METPSMIAMARVLYSLYLYAGIFSSEDTLNFTGNRCVLMCENYTSIIGIKKRNHQHKFHTTK